MQELRAVCSSKEDNTVNRQTALGSIDVLARHLAAAFPKHFAPALDTVVTAIVEDNGTAAPCSVLCLC